MGNGAAAIIQSMRRHLRRHNAHRAARRAVGSMQRAEIRRCRRTAAANCDSRHAFACASCLRLRVPPDGAPQRRPDVPTALRDRPSLRCTPDDACECGDPAWVDLAIVDHAAQLRRPVQDRRGRRRAVVDRALALVWLVGLGRIGAMVSFSAPDGRNVA